MALPNEWKWWMPCTTQTRSCPFWHSRLHGRPTTDDPQPYPPQVAWTVNGIRHCKWSSHHMLTGVGNITSRYSCRWNHTVYIYIWYVFTHLVGPVALRQVPGIGSIHSSPGGGGRLMLYVSYIYIYMNVYILLYVYMTVCVYIYI